jgi:TatD DNase family protein
LSFYVDVHTHLTHEDFYADRAQVIKRARQAGLGAIVVNGLEPQSNREILAMAKADPLIRPALCIYPLDAVCDMIPEAFPFPVAKFDVLSRRGVFASPGAGV